MSTKLPGEAVFTNALRASSYSIQENSPFSERKESPGYKSFIFSVYDSLFILLLAFIFLSVVPVAPFVAPNKRGASGVVKTLVLGPVLCHS